MLRPEEASLRILMVCLGNICRSPMADGLLRRKVMENKLPVYVDSAGTANYHVGEAPDKRMIQTGAKFNTPIHDLRARQFTVRDFDQFEVIYCMDASNYENICRLARNEADKAKVLFMANELYPTTNTAVPDPYYGSMHDFEEVYHLLDACTDKVIEKIKDGKFR